MKVCIPVSENKGIGSKPYNHFGSAPLFLIVDSENEELRTINNGDLDHDHGKCQPLKALEGQMVDVVLVRGIGAGAIVKLNSMGTKVFKAMEGDIAENLNLLKENKLMEFTVENGCNHHDCGHK
ncbi:MAG: NifB/NifX family molybdenum-iron cluster-binding protein [Terrisporobacter sp.]|uniref:NifB/NifX family molybdenum-iron cluster-binding protein n=1 Tax=Terrisporobacter sp. TaxID=1965305 RepID=UPI002FCB7D14